MKPETIVYEKNGGVGVITLNRPRVKNALSMQLLREVTRVVCDAEEDGDVRALIITGAGQCFSSGADLNEALTDWPEYMRQVRETLYGIERLEKPTIAAIDGWCIAGGLELATICDLRVAAETARIGDHHSHISAMGGVGVLARLSRLIGVGKAKELVFTGDHVDGREAERIGLVERVYSQDGYMAGALELAEKMIRWPPVVLKMAKRAIDGGMSMGLAQASQYNDALSDILRATPERREGVSAFLAKRSPDWQYQSYAEE